MNTARLTVGADRVGVDRTDVERIGVRTSCATAGHPRVPAPPYPDTPGAPPDRALQGDDP